MIIGRRKLALIGCCAALAIVSPAHAEVPQLRIQSGGFDLWLQGGVAAQGAVFDEESSTRNSPDAEFDIFARLNAEWTSPGGVVIGANIEQTNQARATESLNTGEVYGFVASDFGRVEVGEQDGPADTLAFHAPVIALGQVRGDFSRYAGSQALLSALDTRDAFKVIYLSPPISGFRAGVSWSPKFRQNRRATNPRSRVIVRDAIELGAQFQQPAGDWILGLSGGYAFGNADPITTRADLGSWSLGAEGRKGPLRIGLAYVRRGSSNRLDRGFDQREVNAGVGWIADRWGVSFSGAATRAAGQSNRLFGLGGFYAITPNVQIRADVVNFREQRAGRTTDKGTVGLVELQFTI
jgi:Gram-negative porin